MRERVASWRGRKQSSCDPPLQSSFVDCREKEGLGVKQEWRGKGMLVMIVLRLGKKIKFFMGNF